MKNSRIYGIINTVALLLSLRRIQIESARISRKLFRNDFNPWPPKPHVRSIDIVNELSFSKPSVSVAMKNLRENGYIQMDDSGYITLTPSGLAIAEKIYERHTFLTAWLINLGVNEETAQEDACRMEHVISVESFEAIKKHVGRE